MEKIQINLSNKLFYTIILLGAIALLGIGVFAFGSGDPTINGHDAGEISGLADTNAATQCNPGEYLDGDGTCKIFTNAATQCNPGEYLDGDGTCKFAPTSSPTCANTCSLHSGKPCAKINDTHCIIIYYSLDGGAIDTPSETTKTITGYSPCGAKKYAYINSNQYSICSTTGWTYGYDYMENI